MNTLSKIIGVLIIVVLLVSSTYYVFFTKEDGDAVDSEPPVIQNVTGSFLVNVGETATILTNFSDNVGVVEAILHYKKAGDESWNSKSILEGSADIQIPLNSDENWYYYITVNDQKGNGPVGNPSVDGSEFYTITVTEEIIELDHYAFIEEATTTWCTNCPNVAETLYELYESTDYKFYYVSMIGDKSSIANDRLSKDYNVVGYPTVFIDGGYKLIVGDKDKSEYESAINTAQDRVVPMIAVNITAEYDNKTDELTTNVLIENYEDETYTGQLKVYLTEKTSRWGNTHKTSEGKTVPYHYGFLDFVIDEEASIESKGKTTVTNKRKLTEFAISDLYPEDFTLIAVMFSSESVNKYSFPPDQGEFDAYYADAADAAELVPGGDERPIVHISNLEYKKLHLFGNPLFETLFKNTVLIGKTTVVAEAEDDSGIEKVEFYIDDELQHTDTEAPYEYTLTKLSLFKEFFFHKHKITVIAYDDMGKPTSVDLEVMIRL